MLQPPAQMTDIRKAVPLIEFQYPGKPNNVVITDAAPSPRILGTHLQPEFFEKSFTQGSPRVIVLMRNPKDCLVSYYHFYCANAALGKFQGNFDQFFELQRDNRVCYGDVIQHIALWWKYRDDPRFLFLTFEDMKKEPSKAITQIAQFLNIPASQQEIADITEKTSFDKMSKDPTVNKANDKSMDSSVSKYLRKGAVGDWASLFTAEQSRHIDERCRAELEPLGITFDFGHLN